MTRQQLEGQAAALTERQPTTRKHVVALLDTMYGDEAGDAPRYFKINPCNHSGRRLYSLIGNASLLVTDSCRELVTDARQHGKPDPLWVCENLLHLEALRHIDLLLICGKVAEKTFDLAHFTPNAATVVMRIPHPAARMGWTREFICEIKERISAELARASE